MTKTTIQLDESTKDRLDELKRVDGESFDSVVKMLIANYNNSQDSNESLDESDVKAIIDREIEQLKRELH